LKFSPLGGGGGEGGRGGLSHPHCIGFKARAILLQENNALCRL
jgi:hypothetical protein